MLSSNLSFDDNIGGNKKITLQLGYEVFTLYITRCIMFPDDDNAQFGGLYDIE